MRTRRTLLLAGATSTIALLALTCAAPAMAATAVVVTNRETVQVYLTPTGKMKAARVYDQITATGKGTVDLENPVSTDGLRNLDGLAASPVKHGKVISRMSVDGETRSRTVSSFDGQLPVTVKPTYTLNGKTYDNPEDVVGKSGKLEVRYRIENVTSKPETVTVKDGKGNPVKVQAQIPTPLVGSLTTQLPKGFYSVASDQATISGDGRGGTKLTFTMTLLPPIGSTTAEIGYTAQVKDAVIPRATVSIAVVQPLQNPSLKIASDSYKGGAETGATLTAGAGEIDANLLKLRDGAGQLLGGLIQLRDGAVQLNDGLADDAAPGANKLADGAGQVAGGAHELNGGLGRAEIGGADLATGLTKLAGGNKDLSKAFNNPEGGKDLVSGSQDLASGLGLISGGLTDLAAVNGLPRAAATAVTLRDGVDKVLAGLGSPSADGTILNGLGKLGAGADQLASTTAGLPAAKGGVDQVKGGLDAALASGGDIAKLSGGLQGAFALGECDGAITAPLTTPPASDCDYIRAVYAGIEGGGGLRAKTGDASAGLGQVSGGLGTAITQIGVGSSPGGSTLRGGLALVTAGVNLVKLGLSNPACDPKNPTSKTNPCGIRQGLTLLSEGLISAVTGVNQLSAGAKTAASGSGDLATGIAQAGDGADQLAAGSSEAAAGSDELATGLGDAEEGSAKLSDGAGRVATGAGDLAEGLGSASDGSSKIAKGLSDAVDGGKALPLGATKLSKEGTKKLVAAGNDTTLDFGERYAVLKAMAENTKDGGLPYGAPDGATGTAAYSFELAAATHEGGRNRTRGGLAIVMLVGGAALSTLVRARWF